MKKHQNTMLIVIIMMSIFSIKAQEPNISYGLKGGAQIATFNKTGGNQIVLKGIAGF